MPALEALAFLSEFEHRTEAIATSLTAAFTVAFAVHRSPPCPQSRTSISSSDRQTKFRGFAFQFSNGGQSHSVSVAMLEIFGRRLGAACHTAGRLLAG